MVSFQIIGIGSQCSILIEDMMKPLQADREVESHHVSYITQNSLIIITNNLKGIKRKGRNAEVGFDDNSSSRPRELVDHSI
jgi:hypothetical protein